MPFIAEGSRIERVSDFPCALHDSPVKHTEETAGGSREAGCAATCQEVSPGLSGHVCRTSDFSVNADVL